MKKCTSCLSILSLTEFHKQTNSLDGHRPICKTCAKNKAAEYYQKHGGSRPKKYLPDPLALDSFCEGCGQFRPVALFILKSTRRSGYSANCKECQRKNWEKGCAERPGCPKRTTRKLNRNDKAFLDAIRRDYGDLMFTLYLADKESFSTKSKGRDLRVKKLFFFRQHGLDVSKNRIWRIESLNKICGLPLSNIGWNCMACGTQNSSPLFFEQDHIDPRGNGGSNAFSNLQCLCPNCHKKKTLGIDGFLTGQNFKVVTDQMERWFGIRTRYNSRQRK